MLLGSATFAQITAPGSFPVDPFFFLIGLTYALTIVYALTLRLRRAAPLAGRPAARRRRADRLGVHLLHRRHHQLLLVALRAADHRRQHRPVPARRPAGRDAERGALRRPGRWRSTSTASGCCDDPWLAATRRRCRRASVAQYTVGAERLRVLRRRAAQRLAGRTACGRPARGSSRRRPRSPICRRSTSTSSTACRAAWRRPTPRGAS